MSNMSYCRFQNTSKDLQDCFDVMSEKKIGGLSREEKRSYFELICTCQEILQLQEEFEAEEEFDYEVQPQEVKDILSLAEEGHNQDSITQKLNQIGYDIEFDLGGEVVYIKPTE